MKLHEFQTEFKDLITIVANKMHLPESAIERDYYIVMLLKNLADRFGESHISFCTTDRKAQQFSHPFPSHPQWNRSDPSRPFADIHTPFWIAYDLIGQTNPAVFVALRDFYNYDFPLRG